MELQIQIPKAWFDHGYALLLIYLRDHPGMPMDDDYKAMDGFLLGDWMNEVRIMWTEGNLSCKQICKLETIGFSKNKEDQSWESMYRLLQNAMRETEQIPVDFLYKTDEGVMLGAWKDRQQRLFHSLTKEKQEKLRKLGLGKDIDD